MMYSYRIEQAIRAAAILHAHQHRKGRARYPAVVHAFSVACIVADYTHDEDTIIASLLHDTLEHTDYTPRELQKDFGSRVASLVEHISDRVEQDATPSLSERTHTYIRLLKSAPQESLLIAAAEKIHDLRSVVEEYQDHFDEYLRDFHGSVSERVAFYGAIRDVLNMHLKSDIIHEFNHVHDAYKEFIEAQE